MSVKSRLAPIGTGQHRIKTKAVYNVLAINEHGQKEILATHINQAEGAKFWMQVLTDMKNRGLNDILIACTDHLKLTLSRCFYKKYF